MKKYEQKKKELAKKVGMEIKAPKKPVVGMEVKKK